MYPFKDDNGVMLVNTCLGSTDSGITQLDPFFNNQYGAINADFIASKPFPPMTDALILFNASIKS